MDASLSSTSGQRSSSSAQDSLDLSSPSLLLSGEFSQVALMPTARLDQPSLSLSTPQLLSRLQAVQISNRVKAPKGLFERVHEVFFKEPLRLQAQTSKQQVLSVSLQSLLDPLSKQFYVKGSGVARLLASKAKHAKANTPLNDYDLAVRVKTFNKQFVQEQFARRLRDQGKQHKSWLNTLSDEQVLATFFLNPVEGENWLKLRTAVEPGKVPYDILIYQALPAEFDAIQASATIKVDTQARIATVDQPLDSQGLAWLQRHHLLWVNEQMTGGLRRVSRWLAKQPQLRLIQPPPVLERLYQSSSAHEQAHFIVNQLTRTAPTPVLTPLLSALKSAQNLEPVLANNLKLESTELASLQAHLSVCVKVFSGGAQALRDFLQASPDVLAELAPLVEGFVPRPEPTDLIGLWHSQDVLQQSQLTVLLESVSQYIFAEQPRLLELELARASAAAEQDVYGQLQRLNELYQYAQSHDLQTGDLAIVAQQLLLDQLKLHNASTPSLASPSPPLHNRTQQQLVQPNLAPQTTQTEHWPQALASALNLALSIYSSDTSKTAKALREQVGRAQCSDIPEMALKWPNLGCCIVKPRLLAQIELVSKSFKLTLNDVEKLAQLEQSMADLSKLGPIVHNAIATGQMEGSLEFGQSDTQAWIRPDPSRKLVCVFGAKTVYVGENKRIGAQKRAVLHGDGVMIQTMDRLTFIGRFQNDRLVDQQLIGCGQKYFAALTLSQGSFNGPATFVYRTREPGLMSSVRIGSAVFNAQDQKAHLTLLNPLACSVTGQLQCAFEQVFGDPLTAMQATAELVITDHTYIEEVFGLEKNAEYSKSIVPQGHTTAPAQLTIQWQSGQLPSLQIQNYRNRAGHELTISLNFDLAAPSLIPGQPHRPQAWLKVPDSNNPLVEHPSATGQTTVQGHYSRQLGTLYGEATVQYSNGESYVGEVCDHVAHGSGRLMREGQSFGALCQMHKGRLYDSNLDNFIRSRMHGHSLNSSSAVVLPYEIPPRDLKLSEPCYFSLLGANQNRFAGLRAPSNVISGNLSLMKSGESHEIVSQVLIVGKAVQQFWLACLESEFHPAWQDVLSTAGAIPGSNNHASIFHDPNGREMMVVPNAKAFCADHNANWHEHYYAFGLHLNPDLLSLNSQDSSEIMLAFPDKPFRQIMLAPESVTSMIYSLEGLEIWRSIKPNQRAQFAISGVGTHTDSVSHYSGELLGKDAHGKGIRRFIDGASETGTFHHDDFKQGVFEIPDLLRVEGTWPTHTNAANLQCTLQIPSLPDRAIQVPLTELPAVLKQFKIELSIPHQARLFNC